MTLQRLTNILQDLCHHGHAQDEVDFVNSNHITQENIQTITTVSMNDTAYDTIYYWEFKE